MQRYTVRTRPDASLAAAWDAFLDHHVPEVVLRGAFAGALVTPAPDGGRTCDYLAAEGTLERYLAGPAVALRADADARFPTGIERVRETAELRHVSAPLPWAALGLVDAAGQPVACPADGPFTLAVFAPWCPDCHEAWPTLVDTVERRADRAALVGVYAGLGEIAEFVKGRAGVWAEPSAKDESSRVRTAHAWLRALTGDPRRWGVPAVRRIHLEAGRFVVISP